MRITNEILLKLAKDTVTKQAQTDHNLLAAYLHGSLLRDKPLLGNTTDIDLFYVYNDEVRVAREIVRITDEVHLDISHHSQKVYRQPHELRQHPWLGPILYGCKILYDPQHFMDFTQASVRGQFERPDNVLTRTRSLAEHARQIWMGFYQQPREPEAEDISLYLKALAHAADAIAGLSGPPLTERRFLLDYPARAEAIRRPGLYPGFLGLLGAPAVGREVISSWLPAWRAAYLALPTGEATLRFHPHRLPYYERAIEAILGSEHPQNALWPLWHTWTHIICGLGVESPHCAAWSETGERLGLLGPGFSARVAALDAYLDTVEETLEVWARENGA